MGNCVRVVLLAVVVNLVLVSGLWARTMYVSDTFEIVVRSTPEVGRNILKTLPTGTTVKVLELGESWATIQLPSNRKGYVLKRYLLSRLPHQVVAEKLQAEVDQLRAQLGTSEQTLSALRSEHQQLQQTSTDQGAQLQDVTANFVQLQQDAEQYLKLKADFRTLQESHQNVQNQLTILNDDYQLLKKSRNVMWFLSGGGVLLAGWVIGMITERFRGRRRQGSYGYQLPS